MDWTSGPSRAVLWFGIQPTDAWSMTPAEWWMLYDEHVAMHRKPEDLNEDDVAAMKALLERDGHGG